MRKLIAIATGDWHVNDWKNHNEDNRRIQVSKGFITDIVSRSHYDRVPLLFSGDMFHTPEGLSNKLIATIFPFFRDLRDTYTEARILAITGNHDRVSKKGGYYSYVKTLAYLFPPLIQCIDNTSTQFSNGRICGIPYLPHNKGMEDTLEEFLEFPENKILLLHTNLYGAKDPSGYEIDEVPGIPRDMGRYFKDFRLVLSGHIHKPDELWKNHIVMIGAPYQQRSSDSGTTMGYWEVYSDFTVKFIPYQAPGFVYYSGEKPGGDDYYIEVPSAEKFKKEYQGDFSNVNDKQSLAKEYCKAKGIESKERINLLIETLNLTEK